MSNATALRAHLKWSQLQMAECLGCHQSSVHRLEDGGAARGAVGRCLERLQTLVDEGTALPGMPVAIVVDLMIGRLPPDDRPSTPSTLEPQSA